MARYLGTGIVSGGSDAREGLAGLSGMTRLSLVSNFMSSPHPPRPLPPAPVVLQWTGTGAPTQLTKNDAPTSTSIQPIAFNLRCGSGIAAVLQLNVIILVSSRPSL